MKKEYINDKYQEKKEEISSKEMTNIMYT